MKRIILAYCRCFYSMQLKADRRISLSPGRKTHDSVWLVHRFRVASLTFSPSSPLPKFTRALPSQSYSLGRSQGLAQPYPRGKASLRGQPAPHLCPLLCQALFLFTSLYLRSRDWACLPPFLLGFLFSRDLQFQTNKNLTFPQNNHPRHFSFSL